MINFSKRPICDHGQQFIYNRHFWDQSVFWNRGPFEIASCATGSRTSCPSDQWYESPAPLWHSWHSLGSCAQPPAVHPVHPLLHGHTQLQHHRQIWDGDKSSCRAEAGALMSCFQDNNLLLSVSKTEGGGLAARTTSVPSHPRWGYRGGRSQLPSIVGNKDLSWPRHVAQITKAARQHLLFLRKSKGGSTRTSNYSTVESIPSGCITTWHGNVMLWTSTEGGQIRPNTSPGLNYLPSKTSTCSAAGRRHSGSWSQQPQPQSLHTPAIGNAVQQHPVSNQQVQGQFLPMVRATRPLNCWTLTIGKVF